MRATEAVTGVSWFAMEPHENVSAFMARNASKSGFVDVDKHHFLLAERALQLADGGSFDRRHTSASVEASESEEEREGCSVRSPVRVVLCTMDAMVVTLLVWIQDEDDTDTDDLATSETKAEAGLRGATAGGRSWKRCTQLRKRSRDELEAQITELKKARVKDSARIDQLEATCATRKTVGRLKAAVA